MLEQERGVAIRTGAAVPRDANLVRDNTSQRSRSDMYKGQYPTHEPRGYNPPGTREKPDTEPNAD